MIEHIIVTGPRGCGKARNAERIKEHFGCARVIDLDRDPTWKIKVLAMHEKLLLLTRDPDPMAKAPDRRLRETKVVQFHDLPNHCRA